MERQKNRLIIAIIYLAIIYAVGIYGFRMPAYRELFRALTPLNLLLTCGLLFAFHRPWNKDFLFFALLSLAVGYGVEWLGVHTQLIFGSYTYGNTLGPKLLEVPPIMSLNWLLLIYCTGIAGKALPLPVWLKVIVSSTLMVLIDVLLEPVAIEEDFWSWAGNRIPLQNYLAWWVISLPLHAYFHHLRPQATNKLAIYVYFVQLIFFLSWKL